MFKFKKKVTKQQQSINILAQLLSDLGNDEGTRSEYINHATLLVNKYFKKIQKLGTFAGITISPELTVMTVLMSHSKNIAEMHKPLIKMLASDMADIINMMDISPVDGCMINEYQAKFKEYGIEINSEVEVFKKARNTKAKVAE